MWDVASVDHIMHDVLAQLQTVLLAQVTPLPDDPHTQQSGRLKQQIRVLGGLCREVKSKSYLSLSVEEGMPKGVGKGEVRNKSCVIK